MLLAIHDGCGNDYCKAYDVCESRKSPIPKSKAPLVQDQQSFPLENVAIDIMGPLPISSRGNRYLVVICDYFTKWTEVFPVPDIRTETVTTVLVDGFFCRYGVPYQLHSDRGAQFESKLFRQMCELLDIRKSRTTSYRPQSDGLVERMNRTLEAMLSAHVNDNQRKLGCTFATMFTGLPLHCPFLNETDTCHANVGQRNPPSSRSNVSRSIRHSHDCS